MVQPELNSNFAFRVPVHIDAVLRANSIFVIYW